MTSRPSPIYDPLESTATSATTKEDLIDAIRGVAGETTLWNKLSSNRLKKNDISNPITVHTYYAADVCMLANSLDIPISSGKEDHPDPTHRKPTIMNRQRAEHKAGSGSTRDTLKAHCLIVANRSNTAEARIFTAKEAGGGDGSNRATRNVLGSIKKRAAGEAGVPSVSQTALRVLTIETNLEASADHVQQVIKENRPDTFWGTPTRVSMDILPPRIATPAVIKLDFGKG